jgi:hypothetical protein
MACADVATAKAKTTAVNLIILSSYVNLYYEPRPTKRKWVDVPTFFGAIPCVVGLAPCAEKAGGGEFRADFAKRAAFARLGPGGRTLSR